MILNDNEYYTSASEGAIEMPDVINNNKLEDIDNSESKLLNDVYHYNEIFHAVKNKLNAQGQSGDIFRYVGEYISFEKMGGKITGIFPLLSDYNAPAGTVDGHYFHQDLLVASFISKASPLRHIDIGSRFDGFISHVASFRKIEVMDVRHLPDSGHENISFLRMDLMSKNDVPENIADSISCLHAIEHFGLGRYGDSIDPEGYIKGFNNILKMIKPGGILYISFPIGKENQILFNAHRIFHHLDIFNWAYNKNSIELIRFDYVDDSGRLFQNVNLNTINNDLNYGCGIYTFKKIW